MFEILLYRVLRPLLRTEADWLPAWFLSAGEWLAVFSLNLVSVLAVAMAAGGLIQAIRPGGPSRTPAGSIALAMVSLLYLPLSLSLLLLPSGVAEARLGSARAMLLLHVCFLCLALLLTISVLPLRGRWRFKAGMLLLLLPIVLQFYAFFNMSRSVAYQGELDVLAYGQGALVAAAGLSLLCFLPEGRTEVLRRSGAHFAGVVAVLVALGGAALILLDWEMASRILRYAVGFALPTARIGQAVYLAAFASLVFTVVTLLLQGGAFSLRGMALLLIALGGYQVQENHRLALILCGLLGLVQSAPAVARRPQGAP